ncbi:DUF6207 family protein [Streptomyces sp. NPDC051639]|uniref:DUF6207 family protein n=1 Tax=unclassified Streptomyces TaxID=2593676 RepID=UPI0034178C8B
MWAATSAEHTTRDPGQPGLQLRCYLDMRQTLSPWPKSPPAARPRPSRPHGAEMILVGPQASRPVPRRRCGSPRG